MYLSDFDLQQLDEQQLTALPAEQKEALLVGIHLSRDTLASRSGTDVPDMHRYEQGKRRATLRFCPTYNYNCPALSW